MSMGVRKGEGRSEEEEGRNIGNHMMCALWVTVSLDNPFLPIFRTAYLKRKSALSPGEYLNL